MHTILYRIVDNPKLAKQYGWSKNHRLMEVYVVGKWRTMEFLTPKQLEVGKWKERLIDRLKVNGGIAKDVKDEMVEFQLV